jgi:hypothetical protein
LPVDDPSERDLVERQFRILRNLIAFHVHRNLNRLVSWSGMQTVSRKKMDSAAPFFRLSDFVKEGKSLFLQPFHEKEE